MIRHVITGIALLVASELAAFEAPKYAHQCLSCHGIDGRPQISYVPIIHGQQPAYLRDALHAYREGWRHDGRGLVMTLIVKDFSDAELDALANWFGQRDLSPMPAATTIAVKASTKASSKPAGGLVYIDQREGWRRVLTAINNRDYFLLNAYLESEKFLTFCAIASMAGVLNSLDIKRPLDPLRYPYPYFTQENIFVLANEKVRTFEQVVASGLDLAQIGAFLRHLGAYPEAHFADATSVDQMRAEIRQGLERPDARVIVNYDRSVLGQAGEGHVSPIGAYDKASDSVLVLDVAKYKYPPAWVPIDLLYKSMLRVDSASKRSRGIVVVGAKR